MTKNVSINPYYKTVYFYIYIVHMKLFSNASLGELIAHIITHLRLHSFLVLVWISITEIKNHDQWQLRERKRLMLIAWWNSNEKLAISHPAIVFCAFANGCNTSHLGKCLIHHILYSISVSWRKVRKGILGRNFDARTETEAMEEHSLLDYSLWLAQPAFLYNPGVTCP